MVADIARVTYDPTRQYRSLIAQQGRVTLEADNNESVALESEARRLETIDIVGPYGTPDNGYAVSAGSGPGGVTIGKGILYLGGWRLELHAPVDLAKQPDWVDAPPFTIAQGNLVVSLLLTEQSISAAEDRALREVALGGPDSAARSRLMQRFLRIQVTGSDCAAGAATVAGLLKADGVTVDPASFRLLSSARLQAGFVAGPASTDPCTPAAAGGYLGADNQMVRVTVTQYDATGKTGTLLWGWNNASLLYRASIAADGMTVTLIDTPVDQEHAPQQNQMVEILRTTTDLGDNNYIADGQGDVRQVGQAYSFDTQALVLATPVDSSYLNNADPLFVRLWQAEVAFNAGTATPLDSTSGLTVAITMDALPSNIAARPFWHFAVRPATPQNIYPARYADAPQPPDGPRQWIADLAVVQALASGSTLLSDCRVPFLPLTKQSGGCCGLVLGPDEVAGRGGLQAVIDSLAGGPAVLALRAGTYALAAPLKLGKANAGLTIEACTSGVILQASGTDMTPFKLGLITLDGVSAISLRGLQFTVPDVPVAVAGVTLSTMFGMLVQIAQGLIIEACSFSIAAPASYAFGAAILVLGPSSQVALRQNVFTATGNAEVGGVLALVTEANTSAELDQWEISGNQFSNLAYGVVGFAQLGLVACRANIVTGCAAGLIFVEANLGQTSSFASAALQNSDSMNIGTTAYSVLRPDLLTNLVTKVAPIQSALSTSTAPAVAAAANQALASQMSEKGIAIYKTMAASIAPAAASSTVSGAAAVSRDAAVKQPAVDTASFDELNAIAVASEVSERELTPALRFADNEVTLSGAVTTPWIGIGVALSPDEPGSVMVTGNRVVVPDATTAACGLLFPAGAVVTGNLFVQLASAPRGTTNTPSLILFTSYSNIMVSANVIVFTEAVLPARPSQLPPTSSWDFLNTVA